MVENDTHMRRRSVLKMAGGVVAGATASAGAFATPAAADDGFEMETLPPDFAWDGGARVLGEIAQLDESWVDEWYFEYGVAGNGLPNESRTRNCTNRFGRCQEEGETVDKYIVGLDSGTDYEVRVVAETADGRSDKGSVVTFTTDQ